MDDLRRCIGRVIVVDKNFCDSRSLSQHAVETAGEICLFVARWD